MAAQIPGPSHVGRWFGGAIFGLGVALLASVFVLAAVTFRGLPQLVRDPQTGVQGLTMLLAIAALRAVFLVVMAHVSSLLASKGLELYAAARSEASR